MTLPQPPVAVTTRWQSYSSKQPKETSLIQLCAALYLEACMPLDAHLIVFTEKTISVWVALVRVKSYDAFNAKLKCQSSSY